MNDAVGASGESHHRAQLRPVDCPGALDDELAFAGDVVSFEPGVGAGFGREELPGIVLGPPDGGGEIRGSLDVVSLGAGGSITVELSAAVVDCDGADLVIFENPFRVGGGGIYTEYAAVSLSWDGKEFVTVPCDVETGRGCAGRAPVTEQGDPRDPAASGGDLFDLADIGVRRARFVRIDDLDAAGGLSAPPQRGFDLDAIAVARGHGELP